MLTEEQKQKLDDSHDAAVFERSDLRHIVDDILVKYRDRAVEEINTAFGPAQMLEAGRRIQAANDLIRHVEVEIQARIALIEDVAAEVGLDLDELKMRREING